MSAAVSLHDGKAHLRVVSDSELRVARACLQRHHFAYRMLRRPIDKGEALRFGSLWHVGQEAWWLAALRGESAPLRLASAVSAMRASEGVDPYQLVMAEELMLAYTARWGDAPIRPVAVERQFEMALINPETGHASKTFRRGGKIDGIAVETTASGEEEVIVEHKSTASDIEEGSTYWRKVTALDTQVSTYLAGARSLGYAPRRCVYDVVRKPGIRPLKATPVESRKYTAKGFLYANQREADETPEEYRLRLREEIQERPERYLARKDIVRLETEERAHAFDVWATTRLLRAAELAGFTPKNPDACSSFGGCPYLPVCVGEASIDDDTRYRTAAVAHEELASD